MPSRKQRRRRQKERRHEYEFVYVDEEGHEVEVDPGELEQSERSGTATRRNGGKVTRKSQGERNRPVRKIDPPSWKRVSKRALFFGPLIFLAFSVLNSKQPVATRLLLAILYTGFFIPFMYLMDRAMYRTYLRRTGQAPPPRTGLRR
jgi:hypothetical protein